MLTFLSCQHFIMKLSLFGMLSAYKDPLDITIPALT